MSFPRKWYSCTRAQTDVSFLLHPQLPLAFQAIQPPRRIQGPKVQDLHRGWRDWKEGALHQRSGSCLELRLCWIGCLRFRLFGGCGEEEWGALRVGSYKCSMGRVCNDVLDLETNIQVPRQGENSARMNVTGSLDWLLVLGERKGFDFCLRFTWTSYRLFLSRSTFWPDGSAFFMLLRSRRGVRWSCF